MDKNIDTSNLPLPLAAELAQTVAPKETCENSNCMFPTADDDVNGLNTYTDDCV